MFGQVLFCNISSNGEVSPIDQSATTTYGVPQGMAVDSSGNLYVAYSGDAILKYTTNGATLFASGLGAPNFLCFDNLGNLYGSTNGSIIRIATNGTSAIYAAGIAGLNGFCFDGNGNLFASSSAQIVRITPGGTTNVFATASGISTNGSASIVSVTIDGGGNLYAAETISQGYFYFPSGLSPAAVFRLDTNGNSIAGFPIGGQYGTGANIVADEVTNVISSEVWHRDLDISGPFGIVNFSLYFAYHTYVAYTPINESLAVYAPTIILQPQDQTVGAGSSMTFASGAVGSSPISYQWFFNQTNLMGGATNQDLTLTNVNSNQIGQYSVVANNYLGSSSSQPASLNVLPTLTVNMVPAISLYGGAGITYYLQYINAYGPTNAPWITLATITLTNSPQFYFDASAIGQPQRFYRSVQAP